MTEIIRSSRQASNIYGLGFQHPPRPKNLFYISFTRGTDTSQGSTSSMSAIAPWLSELSFLVKSSERPQVQPVTEELNQYNKKRIVYTGVKYAPMRIVFYDTTDNLAMQMFADYASNFFGAFGHDANRTDYDNDVTVSGSSGDLPFKNDSGTGWGFSPTAASNTNTDINSHYYFRTISIYEVWGNKFVQTDIINPRITAFDPEGMSFEDSAIATISMTLAYEAIVYVNKGQPQAISSNSAVSTAFAGSYAGDTVDYDVESSQPVVNDYTDYQYTANQQTALPYLLNTVFSVPSQSTVDTSLIDTTSVVPAGPLATYGDYDFGSSPATIGMLNAQADLLGAALTSSVVASAMNATASLYSPSTSTTQGVTTGFPTTAISTTQADVATAAVEALGGYPVGPETTFYAQKIAAGAMSAASAFEMPREQVFTQNPSIQSGAPNSWDSSTPSSNGVAMSSATYSVLNQSRPASAQIGFNTRTLRSQSG